MAEPTPLSLHHTEDEAALYGVHRVENAGNQALGTLKRILRPLLRHVELPEVSEIAICAPQLCFHKLRNPDSARTWRAAHDPEFTHEYLLDALHAVANTFSKPFGTAHPVLFQMLPGWHRLTAAVGQNIVYDEERPEGGVSITIRQGTGQATAHITLEDSFGLTQTSTIGTQQPALAAARKAKTRNAFEAIYEAVARGDPILLSGPTDSGKTTFINKLLELVPEHMRIITVQDACELIVQAPNHVHITMPNEQARSDDASIMHHKRLLNLIKRSTPDAILVGEINPANAGVAYELMQTGHGYFWTSIHAGNPQEAWHSFALNARHELPSVAHEEIMATVRARMTTIQTARDVYTNERYVAHVELPTKHGHAAG